jgi:hypothetical protein
MNHEEVRTIFDRAFDCPDGEINSGRNCPDWRFVAQL